MDKKLTSGVLAIAIICVLTTLCFVLGNNQLISKEQEVTILNEYQAEFAFIERECGQQVSAINHETIEIIRDTANRNIYNEDYRFSELMTDISIAQLMKQGGTV